MSGIDRHRKQPYIAAVPASIQFLCSGGFQTRLVRCRKTTFPGGIAESTAPVCVTSGPRTILPPSRHRSSSLVAAGFKPASLAAGKRRSPGGIVGSTAPVCDERTADNIAAVQASIQFPCSGGFQTRLPRRRKTTFPGGIAESTAPVCVTSGPRTILPPSRHRSSSLVAAGFKPASLAAGKRRSPRGNRRINGPCVCDERTADNIAAVQASIQFPRSGGFQTRLPRRRKTTFPRAKRRINEPYA